MKVVSYSRYGGAEELGVEERPMPEPGATEILVRLEAVSLNASDVEFLRGSPAYTRAWGLFRPRNQVLGSDCAGRVVAVGREVTRFRTGDRVLGDLFERWGGLAEYVAAPEKRWVHLPADLSPELACMLPQAGVVAWQSLHAIDSIQGKRVLINGAGGGSGTLAIQMARLLGAGDVIAVDRGAKGPSLLDLGATRFIDFEREDYAETVTDCDLIVDLVGSRTIRDNARALARDGRYALVGGSVGRILGVVTWGSVRALLGGKKFGLLVVKQSPEAIDAVVKLCAEGKIAPVLGRQFELQESRRAFEELIQGSLLGKAVIVPSPGRSSSSAAPVLLQ